jgi:hypothetical protein
MHSAAFSTIPAEWAGTLYSMKTNAVLLCLTLSASLAAANARADEPRFDLDQDEYAVGVRGYGLDEDTRVIGWQLTDGIYFGRRQGEIDDFGFVFQRGDTQYSVTEHGIGWRRSISLLH